MDTIRLIITGDFCAIHPERLSLGDRLTQLLDDSDLKCVNFEGPLQIGKVESANGTFLLQSHKSPKWLVDHGFNIVSLANNHACDFGESGLYASNDAFEGVVTLGCGNGWDEAYRVRYVDVKGKKIGFFNATSADFSSLKDQWTDSEKFGCAWINHPSVPLLLYKAKQECDYLIVFPHAGVEYMDVPLPEWRAIYRNFIDCGADAVIASHPHVPQGWEIYKEKPIYYSLGNFVFEKDPPYKKPNWYNGLIVELILFGEKINATHYNTLYADNKVEIDTIQERIDYINSLGAYLRDDMVYMNRVNEVISGIANKYEQWMLSGLGAICLIPFNLRVFLSQLIYFARNRKADGIFLHQLREESTRWTIIRKHLIQSKINR